MSMLRRQDYAVELGEVVYVAPPAKKCATRAEKIAEYRKIACGTGKTTTYGVADNGVPLKVIEGAIANDHKILNSMYKANACNPFPPCYPMKKCNAKTSTLHDGSNTVHHELVGLGIKGDANMGYLYNTFREVNIVDTDELVRQTRAGNAPVQDQITKEAEYKAGLYGGSYHAIDGVGTGTSCVKCPPRKKPCPTKTCKRPDPMNNDSIGIGSDGLQSRESLQGLFEAGRIAPEVASFLGTGTALPQRSEAAIQTEMEEEEEELTSGQVRDLRHEGLSLAPYASRDRMQRAGSEPPSEAGTAETVRTGEGVDQATGQIRKTMKGREITPTPGAREYGISPFGRRGHDL